MRELIQKGVSFGALVSLESTAGDIVQGLPKVDELLEAREPVEKIGSSIHTELAVLFLEYSKRMAYEKGVDVVYRKFAKFSYMKSKMFIVPKVCLFRISILKLLFVK